MHSIPTELEECLKGKYEGLRLLQALRQPNDADACHSADCLAAELAAALVCDLVDERSTLQGNARRLAPALTNAAMFLTNLAEYLDQIAREDADLQFVQTRSV